MVKRAIPTEAYSCSACRSSCSCHHRPHAECPRAITAGCIGGCGRRTTSAESCKPGLCRACAHEPGPSKELAWRVRAQVRVETGFRKQDSEVLSYSDALELGWRLEGAGARQVRLVEVPVAKRPPSRLAPRRPLRADKAQLDMFAGGGRRGRRS